MGFDRQAAGQQKKKQGGGKELTCFNYLSIIDTHPLSRASADPITTYFSSYILLEDFYAF